MPNNLYDVKCWRIFNRNQIPHVVIRLTNFPFAIVHMTKFGIKMSINFDPETKRAVLLKSDTTIRPEKRVTWTNLLFHLITHNRLSTALKATYGCNCEDFCAYFIADLNEWLFSVV